LAVAGRRQPLWLAYSLPFITTAVTLLVVEAAARGEPVNTPVIVFVLPILLSAYAGGLVPGLLSTLLSALATVYFVLPPVHTWSVASPADNIKWITLAAAGTLISFLMGHREQPGTEPLAQHSRAAGSLLLSAQRRVQAGFAVLLTCLIAMAAVSYPMLVRLRKDAAGVEHSHRVIATLRLLISSATDAETGERGYIITGKEEFLEPYHSGLQAVNHALSEVRRLTTDNPEQQRRLDVLEPIVAERLAVLKEGIERRDQAFSSAQAFISSGAGKLLHDRIRQAVAEMEASEEALLAKREGIEQRAAVVAKIVIVGGGALAVLIVAVALWMIGEAFTASRSAETALEESRDQLEVRVNARTSELRTSEQRIAGIISSAMDAVITVDEGQRIVLFNPTAEKLFGCNATEALGHPLERFIPQRFRTAHAHHVLLFGQSGLAHKPMSARDEICGLRADGTEFPIEASISQATAGEKKVFTVILRDITERQRAEEALRQSLERLERVLEVETVGVMFWDLNTGCMVDANDAFLKLMGYSRSEVEARELTWQKLTPPEYMDVSRAEVEKFLATGRVGPYEKEYFRKDGTRRWLLFAGSSLGNNQCVEFCVDISERKKAEEALAQRAQELARSNADLAQFAYVASHDLKEPLRAVSGCVGLLKGHYEGKLDEQSGEYMTHIVDGAARMETLIDGLLAYSRVGTRGGELQPVEGAKALGTALQNLAAAIEESGAVVTCDALPTVRGDAQQLGSLFQNLIGNALKFRREAPPRIHVSAERNGTHWRFSVRDNGIGIAPQYFERIFGVFQRLHTRREYPGTGIGLALCKKIVERHGGRIWVESVPGEGATFYFGLLDAQTKHRQHGGEFHA
jgi:PAS domain S-box-containing protein